MLKKTGFILLIIFLTYSVNTKVFAAESESLAKSDELTIDQINYLIDNHPYIPQDSMYKKDGVSEKLYQLQKEKQISIIGLLSISCTETGFGTSNQAKEKYNFFGFGSYDNNKSNAHDLSNQSVADAMYYTASAICNEYISNGQDTYRKMRYNNGKHEYCTSDAWVGSNNSIRNDFEEFLNSSAETIY